MFCYSTVVHYVSRATYDNFMKDVAQNLAAISSGFETLSSQIPSQNTPNPAEAAASVPHVAASTHLDPSDDPEKSWSSTPICRYTRLPLPQLNREDYKEVKMWYSQEYSGVRKGEKKDDEDTPEASSGSSALSSYMEDATGNHIPEPERIDIRERARVFWEEILHADRAPPVWKAAPKDIKDEFTHILESEFPWIRLCAKHWKAKKIAANHYSQWYHKAYPRKLAEDAQKRAAKAAAERAAREAAGLDTNDNSEERVLKRPRDEGAEDDNVPGPSKHLRVEECRSPSPPRRPKLTRRTGKGKQVHKMFSPDYIKCLYTRQNMLYEFPNYMREKSRMLTSSPSARMFYIRPASK